MVMPRNLNQFFSYLLRFLAVEKMKIPMMVYLFSAVRGSMDFGLTPFSQVLCYKYIKADLIYSNFNVFVFGTKLHKVSKFILQIGPIRCHTNLQLFSNYASL